MGIIDRCNICNRPVVEIYGEYFYSSMPTSFYFHFPDALEGMHHAKCAAESNWIRAWAEFRIRELPTDRYEIYEDPDSKVVVALDRNTRDGTAFRANGAAWELERRDFRRSTVLPDGGRIVPRIRWNEGHYEFPGFPNLAGEIQRALKDCGSYPFLELFRKLGIENRILNPEAVAAGRLAYRADLEQYWTETQMSAVFQVYKYYPPDIAHAWFMIRRKLNP